jgi:DNA-binding NarL/FixJ family response regulator
MAATEHLDVILMDLEMPVIHRWEPVWSLKNDPQTRDVLIIPTGCDEFDVKRSSSSLCSSPFGVSSQTRNNSSALG